MKFWHYLDAVVFGPIVFVAVILFALGCWVIFHARHVMEGD